MSQQKLLYSLHYPSFSPFDTRLWVETPIRVEDGAIVRCTIWHVQV
jgi:hypothetical protein